MNLQKCDKCKRVINDANNIVIGVYRGGIDRIDLCGHCSPVFLRFLKKYAKIKIKEKS